MLVRLSRSMLRTISIAGVYPKLSLLAKSEGSRFALVQPAASKLYTGALADPDVLPHAIGGTWAPKLPPRTRTASSQDLLVALHFHGGAFVIGDGRDQDSGFTADVLRNNAGCTHVFTPQYRLAHSPNDRFPAALQDAVSAYMYLIKQLGIPADRIVLGGDSAGGNIALALLRYIHNYGAELDIPPPVVAVLWSPWTDVNAGEDSKTVRSVANYNTDYLDERFIVWGTNAITGGGKIPASDPYLSPGLGHGFASPTPIWVQTGGLELLYNENKRFVETFQRAGTEIEWVVDLDCPHDLTLMGKAVGFEAETRAAATKAGLFIRRHCH